MQKMSCEGREITFETYTSVAVSVNGSVRSATCNHVDNSLLFATRDEWVVLVGVDD